MKTTTIQKWGNSYAVRIPRETVDSMDLTEGQAVQIEETVDGKSLTITPSPQAALSLESLLSRITPENRHQEVW
jgi:antitoxin MazE